MPLYEYKCDKCGDVFELIQKFSDEPIKVHEKCGGGVHKLISRSALQFKGTGWYVTDYAKSGSSGSAGGSKTEHSQSEGKSGGATGEGSKDSGGSSASPGSGSGDSSSKSESSSESSSKPVAKSSDK